MANYNIIIDYSGCFELMEKKHISQNTLIKKYGFTSRQFMTLKSGGNVEIYTLLKLARILEVTDLSQLVSITPVISHKS